MRIPSVVNSNQEKLSLSEVLFLAVANGKSGLLIEGNNDLKTAMEHIVKLSLRPNVELVQFGNTAFMILRGEGELEDMARISAYNMDTGRNYIRNLLEFVNYAENKNILRISALLQGEEQVRPLEMVKTLLAKRGEKSWFLNHKTDPNKKMLYIELDGVPNG